MSVIYRNIKEQTDVYVAGCYFDTIDKCLLVDDDYISVEVRSGAEVRYVDTDGGAYVLTKEEMIEFLKGCNVPAHDSDLEFVVIRGFKGNIILHGSINSEDVLTEANYDRKDHLRHLLYDLLNDDDDSHRFPEIDYYLEFEGDYPISPVKSTNELLKLV